MKTFTPGQRVICEMDLCSAARGDGVGIRFFTAGNEYIVSTVTPGGNVACRNDDGMEHFLGLDAEDDPSWSNHFRPAYVETFNGYRANPWMNEPWPDYLEVIVIMSADPDGPDAACISFEDYRRAKACVDACKGMDSPAAQIGALQQYQTDASRKIAVITKHSDELAAALELCMLAFQNVQPQGQPMDSVIGRADTTARAALAKAKP